MDNTSIFRACFFILLVPLAMATAAMVQEHPPLWQMEFTDLTVEIDPAGGLMKGDSWLRLKSPGSGAGAISLDLNHELTVLSVADETGRPLAFDRNGGNLTVHPEKLPLDSEAYAFRVRYEGAFSERVRELDLREAWVGPPASFALDSSRWYPSISGPVRRSKGKITYLVPQDWVVASVGKLAAEETLPAAKRFFFQMDSPVEFSFAAAPFTCLREKIDGLEVGVYFLAGGLEKTKYYLENSSKIVRFFKDFYGFFPYDGYSLIELPPDLLGNAGGGSYEGLTFYASGVLPDRFFFAPVFGHEIGHLWWGNCVRGAEGPVINEGLAQISMGLYIEHLLGEKAFRKLLKNGAPEYLSVHSARTYFHALQSPPAGDQPLLGLMVRGEDLELGLPAEDKFNTLHMLANSKGFFIYAMLRDLIGQDAFRQGLRGSVERFAWKTMTLQDLRTEFEKASGRELKWFFNQWFFRKGAPEFHLSYAAEPQGQGWLVKGLIAQVRDVYRITAKIAFINGSTTEIRSVEIVNKETAFSFVFPYKPESVIFDPDYQIFRWTDEFKF